MPPPKDTSSKKDATLVVGNQPKPSFKENKKNPVKDISKDVLPLPGFRDKPEDTELVKLIKERQIKPRGPKQPYELASGAATPTASPIDAAVLAAAGIPQLVGRGIAGALPYLDAPLTVGSKVFPSVTANNVLNAAGAAYSGEQIINPESDLRTNPNAENILMTGLGLVGLPYTKAAETLNPVLGFRGLKPKAVTSSVDDVGRGLDLEELRRVYHNSERFLKPEEIKLLHKNGHGLRENYRTNMSNYGWGTDQWNVNNQLPPPPSEIQMMPDGTTRTIYNQQPIYDISLLADDYVYLRNGLPASNYPHLTREQILQKWKSLLNNPVQPTFKPKNITNKSGLTKEEAIAKASSKDKDAISKMSENEFENTILKPTGEITTYKPSTELDQMTYDLSNKRMVLKDQIPMTEEEYVDAFNEKLDLLNDIIAKKNKSGVEYKVKGLNKDGILTFDTPEQTIPAKLTSKQQANIEWFNRDPEDWLKNKAGLKQEENKWVLSDEAGGKKFNSINEAIEFVKEQMKSLTEPQKISGQSIWGVKLNPGQWRGEVEDIANTEYYRSIPGLEMSNTTSGVFADNVARKGTGAYESINEYLKKLDLGRVKPGFNSQTDFSRGAWENFIKSGRGVGFYANPKTVYGTMRSLFPYIGLGGASTLVAEGLQENNQEHKYGGNMKLNKYNYGGYMNKNLYPNGGNASVLNQSNITTGEVQAKENNFLDKDKKDTTLTKTNLSSNPSIYSGKDKTVNTSNIIGSVGSGVADEIKRYSYKPTYTEPINYGTNNPTIGEASPMVTAESSFANSSNIQAPKVDTYTMDTTGVPEPTTSSTELGQGPKLNSSTELSSTAGKSSGYNAQAASNAGNTASTALNVGNQIYNATKNVNDKYNTDLATNEKYNKEYNQAQSKYKKDQGIVDTTATTLGTIGTVMSAIPVVNAFSWIPGLLAAGTKAIGDPIVDADYEKNTANASIRNYNTASPETYTRTMKVGNTNNLAPESNMAKYGGKMYSWGSNIYAMGGPINTMYAGGGSMYNMPTKGLTHEQHPWGGYPIGGNNYVEGGEVILDKPNGGKYIFSNRLIYK